ncbi:MAG: ABC transporter ATP-binding protein [Desulfobulbaceae bacterium]|nr:ABC transporter ATP-binding protein [Desulfobulbaceae bacterium]
MSKNILEVECLYKSFPLGDQEIDVLRGVSLTVTEGEFIVISGSSGSGKTTLLGLLSGLDRPSRGNVHLDGHNITHFNEDQLAPVRNELTGFVFQAFHLIPSLSALENIMFPAELRKDKYAEQKAQELLVRVGLSHRQGNFPSQMSGGEQQRVAICRALINTPKIVFADEPTGNLDSENSDAIVELLLELHKDRKTTLIIATHSHSLAERADRVIRLHDGELADRNVL